MSLLRAFGFPSKSVFVLPFICLFQFFGFAQEASAVPKKNSSSTEKIVTICFGENLPTEVFSNMALENLQIQIFDKKNQLIDSFPYDNGHDFQFAIPGEFDMVLRSELSPSHTEGECHHEDHFKRFQLIVLPYRMEFKLEEVAFSTEIIGGMDMQGQTVSIPVQFYSYTNESKKFTDLQVVSAGINTTIQGKSAKEIVVLNPGLNSIIFDLDGQATKNTFIMFDFIDFIDRHFSYSYPTILK
ncbi:MAG: hypothetical protein WC044_06940 [Crocinitomicaceae bacterium]